MEAARRNRRRNARRAGWAVATALLMLPAVVHAASPGTGAGEAKASIDLRIVVPAVLRVRSLAQPDRLALAPEDVARGYLDIEEGAALLVTSNDPTGFDVSLSIDSSVVSRAVARIAGRSLDAAAPSGRFHLEPGRLVDQTLAVTYRLYLSPGARPGNYRWPVAISLVPGA